jgi:hypothetical protein
MATSRSLDSYCSLDQKEETTHDDPVFGTTLALVKASTAEHFMPSADTLTERLFTMRSQHPTCVGVNASLQNRAHLPLGNDDSSRDGDSETMQWPERDDAFKQVR